MTSEEIGEGGCGEGVDCEGEEVGEFGGVGGGGWVVGQVGF